jgi:sarcosine oxidase subunit alpha
VPALEGESLALSLLVAGRETLSRSAKYHRPRGAMCLRGHCEGCLLRVDGNPNAMACRTPARPGMVATSQNAFPHARLDVFRVTDWFFPKHLDHHGLMVGLGETVNRTMQSVARKMAGLGTLPDAAAPVQPAHVHQMDVLVVGGGSAGVAAANALVAEGFSVMLCDREAPSAAHAATIRATPLTTLRPCTPT